MQDENAWLLRGAAGHAGLFSNVPDLLRFAAEILKPASERTATDQPSLFDAGHGRAVRPAARPGGQFAGAGLGYALGELLVRPVIFPRTRSATWASAAVRSGSTWRPAFAVVLLTNRTWPDRQAAELIRAAPARLSRCRPRSACNKFADALRGPCTAMRILFGR